MVQISYLWQQFLLLMSSLVGSLSWRNVLDILIVAMAIYYVIKLVRQTRANSVLKGLAVVLLLTWFSDMLELNALNWILRQIMNTGVVVLVVLFQPELRRGLEQIGRSNIPGSGVLIGDHKPMSSEHDIQEMIHALTNLSRRKVGALIVIENRTGLNDIIASGTMIDAEISSGLIENIFEPNTPLHDGAVVVRSGRITAAACFLPLSENSSISRELGHPPPRRAGHLRNDRRDRTHRLRGNRHHLHGARRAAHPLSGREGALRHSRRADEIG